MGEALDRMVVALAEERAAYLKSGKADRILPVDEQLALRGWCVDTDGNLVRVDPERRSRRRGRRQGDVERADTRAPENTAEPRPEPRG